MSSSSNTSILTGNRAILARRYAEALYELAVDESQLDVVADELRAFKKFYRENADLRELTHSPRLSRTSAIVLMAEVAATSGVSKLTGKFLGLLAKNRRLSILDGTIDSYLSLLSVSRNEFMVQVASARALSAEEETKLAAELQKVTGGTVQIDVRLDPTLLGGLIVKLGSRQIDASLRGKLARLERQLKTQQEAA